MVVPQRFGHAPPGGSFFDVVLQEILFHKLRPRAEPVQPVLTERQMGAGLAVPRFPVSRLSFQQPRQRIAVFALPGEHRLPCLPGIVVVDTPKGQIPVVLRGAHPPRAVEGAFPLHAEGHRHTVSHGMHCPKEGLLGRGFGLPEEIVLVQNGPFPRIFRLGFGVVIIPVL